MSRGNLEDKLYLDRLRAEYEQAFDTWARQVERLQAIISSSSSSVVVRDVQARVVAAESAYLRCRDRLTEGLLQANTEAVSCEDKCSSSSAEPTTPFEASDRQRRSDTGRASFADSHERHAIRRWLAG